MRFDTAGDVPRYNSTDTTQVYAKIVGKIRANLTKLTEAFSNSRHRTMCTTK